MVLVVDDESSIREAVAFALREEGYTVVEAADGKAALDRLHEHSDNLVVLLDISMPGMDGFAVMQAVELEPALAERHAFIVTSAQDKTWPVAFVEQLARLHVAILPKPFDLDKLLSAVAAAAERLAGASDTPPAPFD
jgi:two-component system, OmpR family, alkaline phosphatase synthesis response regulator PhoP